MGEMATREQDARGWNLRRVAERACLEQGAGERRPYTKKDRGSQRRSR